MSWKTGKKLIHYVTFRTLNKVTLVLCRVGRKSLEARIREIFFLPQRHAISYNLISRRDIFSHYAWPIFMILCWIGSKFPFKKFPFLSQFCTLLYQRVFRVFNLRRIFSMKVLFFYTKKNSVRFQIPNFTDYKYFLPMILSIDRKIKKKNKKKGEAIYSSSKSRERKSKPTVFTITRSIYFSPLHPSPPPHSQHEQFLFLRVSVHFILFHGSPVLLLPKIGFPATHFSIKPKACCIPRFSSPVGRSRGHFDRANCLNPRALFAKLCTVPRKLPSPFHPLSNAFHPHRSQPPFRPPREFESSRCLTTRFFERRGKQGGGSVINWELKRIGRNETIRRRVGHGYIENDFAVKFIPCYVCRFWKHI